MSEYTVELDSGTELFPYSGDYEEPSLQINRSPVAHLSIEDENGSIGALLGHGIGLVISRDAAEVFPGIVLNRKRITSSSREGVRVDLVHRGYRELQKWPCDPYFWDEDGNPFTSRDAVIVNPWRYFIFRKAGGTLDDFGDEPAVDGVEIHQVVRALIGTRLVVQHDYRDNTPLRPSVVFDSTNKVQVYADNGQSRPFLQRVRKDNAGFLAGQAVESVPLENGDPDVRAMGDISTVEVVLIGELNGSQHPTIRVARNARAGARTWTAVTLVHTANYRSSGLSAWTGSVDLSADGAAAKNSLGYEVTIPGSDADAATTKLHYAKLTATTVADAGVTEGTIDAYDDPQTSTLADEWVEDDFQGMKRADALERLRKGTVADPAVNPSPHWDMWVDADLAFHFKERRGSVKTTVYSHATANITVLEREEYGEKLAFQVIAVGGGRGKAERVIVDRTEYSAGGLYDSDRDPEDGALYGDLPQVYVFRDQSVDSTIELKRRARANFALIRDPREHYKVRFIGFQVNTFVVGDEIPVSEPDWSLVGQELRVVTLKRSWDGDSGEDLDVQLGERQTEPSTAFQGQRVERERGDRSPARTSGTGSVGGPGVYFDKDRYGRFAFTVPEGVEIERVFLSLTTLPWQATARSSKEVTYDFDNFDSLYSVSSSGFTVNAGATDTTSMLDTSLGAGASDDPHNFESFLVIWGIIHGILNPGVLHVKVQIRSGDDATWNTVASILLDNRSVAGSVSREWGGMMHLSAMDMASLVLANDNTAISAIRVSIENPEAVNQDIANGSFVQIWGIPKHIHKLDFGIYQFDGDDGDGTDDPAYGEDIQFAVDPAVDAAGEPTAFSTDRHPSKFGARGASKNLLVDITGYLNVLANGAISPGEHLVYFKGTAQASGSPLNAQGLSVVSVTPVFKLREAQG